jgi:hypothetical protein
MPGHMRSSASKPNRILVPGIIMAVSNNVANLSSRSIAARRDLAVWESKPANLKPLVPAISIDVVSLMIIHYVSIQA